MEELLKADQTKGESSEIGNGQAEPQPLSQDGLPDPSTNPAEVLRDGLAFYIVLFSQNKWGIWEVRPRLDPSHSQSFSSSSISTDGGDRAFPSVSQGGESFRSGKLSSKHSGNHHKRSQSTTSITQRIAASTALQSVDEGLWTTAARRPSPGVGLDRPSQAKMQSSTENTMSTQQDLRYSTEWKGVEVRPVQECECQTEEDLVEDLVLWLNGIHKWGSRVHGQSVMKDIRTLSGL